MEFNPGPGGSHGHDTHQPCYRDASNYKQWTSFVIKGEMTLADRDRLQGALHDNVWLSVPALESVLGVPLPDPRQQMVDHYGLNHDDHPWVELADAVTGTDAPTTGATVAALIDAAEKCANRGWQTPSPA